MEITMNELVNFFNHSSIFSDKTLPLKGAFKINRYRKDLESDFNFYQEKFGEILNEFAIKNENGEVQLSEDGQQVLIDTDRIDECNERLEELMSMPVTIEDYDFVIDDLGDIDCTPNELEVLMPFFSK